VAYRELMLLGIRAEGHLPPGEGLRIINRRANKRTVEGSDVTRW